MDYFIDEIVTRQPAPRERDAPQDCHPENSFDAELCEAMCVGSREREFPGDVRPGIHQLAEPIQPFS